MRIELRLGQIEHEDAAEGGIGRRGSRLAGRRRQKGIAPPAERRGVDLWAVLVLILIRDLRIGLVREVRPQQAGLSSERHLVVHASRSVDVPPLSDSSELTLRLRREGSRIPHLQPIGERDEKVTVFRVHRHKRRQGRIAEGCRRIAAKSGARAGAGRDFSIERPQAAPTIGWRRSHRSPAAHIAAAATVADRNGCYRHRLLRGSGTGPGGAARTGAGAADGEADRVGSCLAVAVGDHLACTCGAVPKVPTVQARLAGGGARIESDGLTGLAEAGELSTAWRGPLAVTRTDLRPTAPPQAEWLAETPLLPRAVHFTEIVRPSAAGLTIVPSPVTLQVQPLVPGEQPTGSAVKESVAPGGPSSGPSMLIAGPAPPASPVR